MNIAQPLLKCFLFMWCASAYWFKQLRRWQNAIVVTVMIIISGITFGIEDTFRPYLQRGELVSVLDEYLTPFAGFFLYYPNRHNLAPKLRALVDHVRQFRESHPT